VLVAAGVMRVSLAASAAEASIDAWELRADLKAERLESRVLEADRSSLAAPSRIEAVASQTLNMTRPAQVSYLQLPSAPAQEGEEPAAPDKQGGKVLATLVDLAASEAHVMLVGDVGLGASQ
jgi:cell division protein FtsL